MVDVNVFSLMKMSGSCYFIFDMRLFLGLNGPIVLYVQWHQQSAI